MKRTVTKEFTFDAAHYLKDYDGACQNMHGHTYKCQITVSDQKYYRPPMPTKDEMNMVMDFAELNRVIKKRLMPYLDHQTLNDSLKMEQPTAERILEWIYTQLSEEFPFTISIEKIRLWETPTSYATIEKE